ncbi:MAG: LamG domain-containing protein [Minisyncoccales bacterium]
MIKENNCVSGKCLKFDGVDDYIPNYLSPPTTSTTIGFWVKRNNNIIGREQFCWLWNDGGIIGLNNKKLYIYDGANYQTINFDVADNKWHYIARVDYRVPEDLVFYIDGREWGRYESKIFYGANLHFWGTAYNKTDYFYKGFMDDVRMYNMALSSAQIKQNYIAGLNSMLANGNISKEDYNERINNLAYEQE